MRVKIIVGHVTIFFLLFLANVSLSFSHNNVVVVPLGVDGASLQNVVTVGKKYGDFTDPVSAMNSIKGLPNEGNPYLLVIGPGVYTLTEALIMQEHVDVMGSGRFTTKLVGAISSGNVDSTSAIVQGANNAVLRSMSIENTGGSTFSFGIYNFGASPTLIDLSVSVLGGLSDNIAVNNTASSAPTMSDMIVTALGGDYTFGVRNYASSAPTMSGMLVTAKEGIENRGIWSNSSFPTISDVVVNVMGGEKNRGVQNANSASARMLDMMITVSGGTDSNYGVYNSADSYAYIRNSSIEGTTNSVHDGGGDGGNETYIFHSVLTGSVSDDPVCAHTISETGAQLDSSCALSP